MGPERSRTSLRISVECSVQGCLNPCNYKPYCIEHILLMPYAADVRSRMSNAFAMQCDDLLTALRSRGTQSFKRWPATVILKLASGGSIEVKELGSRRGGIRKVVVLK